VGATIILDTNALVRYLTGDIPRQAQLVEDLLTSQEHVFIPEAVFSELDFVLRKTYKQSRSRRREVYQNLLALESVTVSTETREAIALFVQKGKLSLTDCLVVAHGSRGKVASFDFEVVRASPQTYW